MFIPASCLVKNSAYFLQPWTRAWCL